MSAVQVTPGSPHAWRVSHLEEKVGVLERELVTLRQRFSALADQITETAVARATALAGESRIVERCIRDMDYDALVGLHWAIEERMLRFREAEATGSETRQA